MCCDASNHFSYNFKLNLNKLPTKRTDRITLRLLFPGLLAGIALIALGIYELSQGRQPENDAAIRNLIHPWFNLTFFDFAVIALGLWIIISLVLAYFTYKKIFYDGKKITMIYRNPWGQKKVVQEAIKKYKGIRFRIEFFQFGFINKNKYIIELYHKDEEKIAPLYISTDSANIRKIWQDYALKLSLPEIMTTDEGVQERKVKDIGKSLIQLHKDGVVKNDFDIKEPLPESISWVRKSDKSIIKNMKIRWDGIDILAAIGMGIVFLVFLTFMPQISNQPSGVALSVFLLGFMGVCIFKWLTKDKLVIKPHKVIIIHKTFSFSRKKDELFKDNIEAVDVAFNPASERYFLTIIGADKTLIFGKKMPVEDLRWVKKFLINDVIKK